MYNTEQHRTGSKPVPPALVNKLACSSVVEHSALNGEAVGSIPTNANRTETAGNFCSTPKKGRKSLYRQNIS
jgi:hypothetical protein